MNDFIKDLSIKDKKTLSQKALKVVEEVGELAKVILPYDSAPGTNHRFVDRESILEEIADVYLTNVSIAYSLGLSHEDIKDMIDKKSIKWSELQSKEDSVSFPLPFEIHITVGKKSYFYPDPDSVDESLLIEHFRNVCKDLKVKPIVIDLEINDGSILKDVMTSSKYFGDNRGAYDEANRISKELEKFGYRILRTKIETVPWHPNAPTINTGYPIKNGCYFECHIGVLISPDQKEDLNKFVDDLNSGCTEAGIIELGGTAKLSQNFFKKSNDGSKFVNILTYRNSMDGYPKFKNEVDDIKYSLANWQGTLSAFENGGLTFEKVEVEYAIYDTNVSHDAEWLKN